MALTMARQTRGAVTESVIQYWQGLASVNDRNIDLILGLAIL